MTDYKYPEELKNLIEQVESLLKQAYHKGKLDGLKAGIKTITSKDK